MAPVQACGASSYAGINEGGHSLSWWRLSLCLGNILTNVYVKWCHKYVTYMLQYPYKYTHNMQGFKRKHQTDLHSYTIPCISYLQKSFSSSKLHILPYTWPPMWGAEHPNHWRPGGSNWWSTNSGPWISTNLSGMFQPSRKNGTFCTTYIRPSICMHVYTYIYIYVCVCIERKYCHTYIICMYINIYVLCMSI